MRIRVRTVALPVRHRVRMKFTREWRDVDVTDLEMDRIREDHELEWELVLAPRQPVVEAPLEYPDHEQSGMIEEIAAGDGGVESPDDGKPARKRGNRGPK